MIGAALTVLRASLLGLAVLSLAGAPPANSQGKLGIVFMHGKDGTPLHNRAAADAFERAGYLVALPEMCWSDRRIYDRTFEDCLTELDAAVAQLRARGATSIVVGGHSLGGSGALGYGARHAGLAGILTSAPAPNLHNAIHIPGVAENLARAKRLIASGEGDERTEFRDFNVITHELIEFTIRATPRIFVSFNDPEGPANLGANASRLSAPLLVLSGSRDPSQANVDHMYEQAHPNPLNRHIELANTDHLGTLTYGVDAMLDWLHTLPAR